MVETLKKSRGFSDKTEKKLQKSLSRSRSRSSEKSKNKSVSRSRSRSSEKSTARETRSRSRSCRSREATPVRSSGSREISPVRQADSTKRKPVVSTLMGHSFGRIENQGFLTNMLSSGRNITCGNNPVLGELLSTQLGDKSCVMWSPRTASQIAKYKEGKPWWSMVRESEIPVMIHFLLFAAARNSGGTGMKAEEVNAKFGIKQSQLEAMHQAHFSNRSLAEPENEPEAEPEPAAKKKRATTKK